MGDEDEVKKHVRENDTIQQTGFARAEVHEFRQVFAMFDADGSGQINFTELEEMFNHLLPMGSKAILQLKNYLTSSDVDGDREADFPEFLTLMHKLQTENWNDISSIKKAEPEEP